MWLFDRQVPTMLVAWTEEMEQKDEQGRPLMGARLQPYQGPFKYERMVDFLRLLAAVIADKRDGCVCRTSICTCASPFPVTADFAHTVIDLPPG